MNAYRKHSVWFRLGRVFRALVGMMLALAVLMTMTYSADATAQVLDDGNSAPIQNLSVLCCDNGGSTIDATSGTVLGGERDAYIESVAGDLFITQARFLAGTPLNRLSLSNDDGNETILTITYDGNDSNAATLDPTGLGGVDLTTGGAAGFSFAVISNDQAAPVTINIYTDATHHSTATVTITGVKGYFIPFTDFAQGSGATGPADFADVGALQMVIDGTGIPSLDLSIDIMDTSATDYGDLPATYNATTAADNGAFHTEGTIYLGSAFDTETDGTESATATGDDTGSDDEDGIALVSNWSDGAGNGSVLVTVGGGNGCLDGWVDFDQDGLLNEADNHPIVDRYVTVGQQLVTFDVPAGTFPGSGANFSLYARFRLTRDRDGDGLCNDEVELDATSPWLYGAYDGEVEDYQFPFSPTAITLDIINLQENSSGQLWAVVVTLLLMSGATFVYYRRSARRLDDTV
ncbi:MAG: hypothetical protein H6651_17375 [Ardenticatenales bacterium]|nr:hypothetical protein [Ardenticatenales bacterium]